MKADGKLPEEVAQDCGYIEEFEAVVKAVDTN